MDSTVYAFSMLGHIDSFRQHGNEWKRLKSVHIYPGRGDEVVHTSATIAVTLRDTEARSSIYLCNQGNEVRQLSVRGKPLRVVPVNRLETVQDNLCLCAVDAAGRMVLSIGGQLVLQHNDQSQVVKLEGVTVACQDIGFEDEHTFWVLCSINAKLGVYKLVKYTIQ